jgi:serine/threonine-protein kinase mTOR
VNQLGDANEVLNVRAVAVMERMSNKLTGRDFSSGSLLSSASAGPGPALSGSDLAGGNTVTGDTGRDVEHGLSVKDQVQKLILQARSSENLCQSYVG